MPVSAKTRGRNNTTEKLLYGKSEKNGSRCQKTSQQDALFRPFDGLSYFASKNEVGGRLDSWHGCQQSLGCASVYLKSRRFAHVEIAEISHFDMGKAAALLVVPCH